MHQEFWNTYIKRTINSKDFNKALELTLSYLIKISYDDF